MIIEYLTALEGEFWVRLRGAGLTYGADLSHSTEERRVHFSLYRCTDPLSAYKAAKQIIVDYASGSTPVNPTDFGNARASLAYTLIAAKSNKLAAASNAWSCAYDGRKADHSKWLLEQIGQVRECRRNSSSSSTDPLPFSHSSLFPFFFIQATAEHAVHCLKKYIVPLFDGASSVLCISTTSSKLSEMASGLLIERGGSVVSYAGEEAVLKSVTGEEDDVWMAVGECEEDDEEEEEEGKAEEKKEKVVEKKKVKAVTKTKSVPFAFAKQYKCECPKCGPVRLE